MIVCDPNAPCGLDHIFWMSDTDMGKSIVIIGTLDTKEEQLRFLKGKIESRGHKAILMDVSMGGRAALPGDVTAEEIVRLGGEDFRRNHPFEK